MKQWLYFSFSILSGLLINLTIPPYGLYYLEFVALIPLMLALYYTSDRWGLILWYIFGYLAFSVVNFPLVNISYIVFLIFTFFSPLMFVVLGLIQNFLSFKINKTLGLLFIPVLWVGMELLMTETPFTIPIHFGLAQYPNLLFIQIADIFSIYGVDFFIILLNVLGSLVIILFISKAKKKAILLMALILFIIVVIYGYGWYRMNHLPQSTSKITMSTLQGNISSTEQKRIDFNQGNNIMVDQVYKDLIDAAAVSYPDYIVIPESGTIGFIFNIPVLFNYYSELAKKTKTNLILEATIKEKGKLLRNVSIFSPHGDIIGSYKKSRLAHFGEQDFTPSEHPNPISTPHGLMSIQVCFDVCFPLLSRSMSNQGANMMTILANDGFYGYSSTPALHLAEVVFRAVENKKETVFANNSGPSAFIDSTGKIMQKTDYNSVEVLTAVVKLNTIKTVFSQYGYFSLLGLLVGYCFILIIINREY